jgi:hypothetical protein
LKGLYLHDNQLSGSIPSELGNLINLMVLWLHNNQLCGEIPVELKNLSNISLPNQYRAELKLDNNHLTVSDSQLVAWLDSHNPGWNLTQTAGFPQRNFGLQDCYFDREYDLSWTMAPNRMCSHLSQWRFNMPTFIRHKKAACVEMTPSRRIMR